MMAIYAVLVEMRSCHLTLDQSESNLTGSDVASPLTMGSQHKPYGHPGCYLAVKIVSYILKKAQDRKFEKE